MNEFIVNITQWQWGDMIRDAREAVIAADKAAEGAVKADDAAVKAFADAEKEAAGSAAADRAEAAGWKATEAVAEAWDDYEKAAAVSRQRAAEVKAVSILRAAVGAVQRENES